MPEENQLSQEEIEQLLRQAGGKGSGQPTPSAQAATPGVSPAMPPASSLAGSPAAPADANQAAVLDPKEIEALISGAGKSATAKQTPPSAAGEDAEKVLSQEEIERLLAQAGRTPPSVSQPPAPDRETKPELPIPDSDIAPADVEYLLHQAQQALASIDAPADTAPPGVTAFRLEEFSGAPPST